MRTSVLTFFALAASIMAAPTPSPQDASIMPVGKPRPTSPIVGSKSACAAPANGMKKMMWWTTGAPAGSAYAADTQAANKAITSQIESVKSAVQAAGGEVASTINIGKMKGLTIVAPSATVDQIAKQGKDLGFTAEADGCAHTLGGGHAS